MTRREAFTKPSLTRSKRWDLHEGTRPEKATDRYPIYVKRLMQVVKQIAAYSDTHPRSFKRNVMMSFGIVGMSEVIPIIGTPAFIALCQSKGMKFQPKAMRVFRILAEKGGVEDAILLVIQRIEEGDDFL